jgi:hypothetical protein
MLIEETELTNSPEIKKEPKTDNTEIDIRAKNWAHSVYLSQWKRYPPLEKK